MLAYPAAVQPPTPHQFALLYQQLGPVQRKLNRLCKRLQDRGYLPGDPYYDTAVKAQRAVHALCVRTHYASCESGVAGANETKRR